MKQIPHVKKSSEEKGIFYGDQKKQTVIHAMSVKNTKEVRRATARGCPPMLIPDIVT